MNLVEVDKPEVKKTVVIYSGRFQPFHKGHYASYAKLVAKFGEGNVYIGTSNDQSGPKSPFSFKEKKEIATKMFGIPSSKFLQIRNPYQPVEILKKFDGKTTQYIAAVGEKDADRLQGNYFKPYKGKAGYGYDEIGYVYPVPAEQNPISGTDVRKWLGATDKEKAKKGFLKAYPKFDKEVFKMITGKLNENFIKGYPSEEDVKKIHSNNNKFRATATTDDSYVYEPVNEIENIIKEVENDVNIFIKNYFNENLSESKTESIQHFVEFATKRLKLKEQPKISLVGGREFAEVKASLGGFNPDTKEIFVATEGRLTADILRTLAHEMVHRKQDELGLVRNPMKDGADGSPIENQAHAIAGILMREYGRINKQIYNEVHNTKTHKPYGSLDHNFLHHHKSSMYAPDMGYGAELDTYDFDDERKVKPGYQTNTKDTEDRGYEPVKENKNPNEKEMIDGIVDMLNQVEDLTNRKQMALDRLKDFKQNNIEVNGVSFLKRIGLGEDINLDVDKGDTVLMGKFKNKKVQVKDIGEDPHGMPTINGKQATTFRKVDEMGSNDVHLANVMKLYRNATFRKRINAYLFGRANMPANPNAVARELRNMDYKEITQMEKELNIQPDLNEGLLLEGGAYGHMSHPFDDMDLTFGDLKNIITGALNGDLGVVREKTDGQALAISWKNGRLIAARNKGHLANAGANAMGIEGVASKFGGRGGLTDAYNYAMKDLSAAISALSEAQRKKIFNEGKCFMNLEVIWPQSVNVIPYGQALLVFHNTTCYDEKGVAIGADQGASSTLAGMIKQVNADVQSKYTIQGPPITEIPKSDDLSSKQGKYISKLKKLQSEFGLNDSDTVSLYHQSWWENFIDSKAPVKVDKLTKEALVRRWAFGDKSFRLNTISNPKLQEWAIDNDKVNVAKQQKDNIKPFEDIFLGVGADVLDFVGSVLTVHPEKAIRAIKSRFKSVASDVRSGGDKTKIEKLKQELKRLNSLGGIERIVAAEGLVFFYNGKTYKLTGTFAPLNQILGLFY